MLGGFTNLLTVFAAATVLVIPLALAGSPAGGRQGPRGPKRPLKGREILQNLKNLRVILSFGAMLFLYSGYAMVFFFIDGYGREIGVVDTGFFLTLATIGEIGVRLAGGSFFDRRDKRLLAAWTMIGLSLGYVLLGNVSTRTEFLGIGLLLGVGWGVSMPVFNGILFDISPLRFRAFNVNLGMQMFQGGFFLGPFIGGAMLGRWGFSAVFHLCAALGLLAAVFCFCMGPARSLPPANSKPPEG